MSKDGVKKYKHIVVHLDDAGTKGRFERLWNDFAKQHPECGTNQGLLRQLLIESEKGKL